MILINNFFIQAIQTEKWIPWYKNIIRLIISNKDGFKQEMKTYPEAVKKFKSGLILWFGEDYPVIKKVFDVLTGGKIQVLTGLKKAVLEFYKLLEDIKKNQPRLLEQEIADSREKVFDTQVAPLDGLPQKDASISLSASLYQEWFKVALPWFFNLAAKIWTIQDMLESRLEPLSNILMQIGSLIRSRALNFISEAEFSKKMKLHEAEIQKIAGEFKSKTKPMQRLLNDEMSRHKKKVANFVKISEQYKTTFTLLKAGEETRIVYSLIENIKGIDSFHLIFVQFIRRLYHVLEQGNRSYMNDRNCYYTINPRGHDPRLRDKLKDFLDQGLAPGYPELAGFLKECFNFNYLRRIDAHQTPKLEKVEPGDNYKILQAGKDPVIIDVWELLRFSLSYGYFIDALDIIHAKYSENFLAQNN